MNNKIMTPKERAIELVVKFHNQVTSWDCYNDIPLDIEYRLPNMKQCALICVEEMLGELYGFINDDGFQLSRVDYWVAVKIEIYKL